MTVTPRARAGATALAALAATWALFLLPPELVAWDGLGAPAIAHRLTEAAPYDLLRELGDALGLGDYELFGPLVAVSFLCAGLAVLVVGRVAGRWTRALGWVSVLGAPVTVLSYLASDAEHPLHAMWGSELFVLLAMGVVGVVAGIRARRTHRMPRWWTVLLGATLLVLVAGTLLLGYYPHGSLVAFGVAVAVLAVALPVSAAGAGAETGTAVAEVRPG